MNHTFTVTVHREIDYSLELTKDEVIDILNVEDAEDLSADELSDLIWDREEDIIDEVVTRGSEIEDYTSVDDIDVYSEDSDEDDDA